MRSPYNFIVKPNKGRRYDNVKEVGGIDLIVSSSQEDHTVSNRYATVVETPIGYDGEIQKGDTLLVHHNVFKYYYDMKGRQKSGKSYFMDDLFLATSCSFTTNTDLVAHVPKFLQLFQASFLNVHLHLDNVFPKQRDTTTRRNFTVT